jgi:regulator of Ty1 transposition protein 109
MVPAGHPPKLLVAALEAFVFTIPQTASTLIYISKVDSTGYAPTLKTPTPRQPALTKTLLQAFLTYNLSKETAPTPRVFVQLFARSQNQYLFPNSIEGGAKRVIGGARLCGWWKTLFEDVVDETIGRQAPDESQHSRPTYHLTYILPSYEEAEAKGIVGRSKKPLPAGIEWQYLPPYHPSTPSTLNDLSSGTNLTIASLIPTFSDDPKARFLTEILEEGALDDTSRRTAQSSQPTGDEGSHPAKRRRLGATSSLSEIKKARKEDHEEARADHARILEKVSYDEFWERMGFRQECASGDVTGFFGISMTPSDGERISQSSLATSDGHDLLSETVGKKVDHEAHEESQHFHTANRPTPHMPANKPYSVPPPIFARIMAALLNHDFGNRSLALISTQQFLTAVEKIVDTEIGSDSWDKYCTIKVPRNTDPNTVAVHVDTPSAAPVVNTLQVKRKKKPPA